MKVQVTVSPMQRSILAKLAQGYGCDVPELARVAIEELIAAHEPPRRKRQARRKSTPKPTRAAKPAQTKSPSPAPPSRTYASKPCAACGKPFTPTGPNSKVCAPCRGAFASDAGPLRSGNGLEKVWDGTMGRQGASLTSH